MSRSENLERVEGAVIGHLTALKGMDGVNDCRTSCVALTGQPLALGALGLVARYSKCAENVP